MKTDDWFDQKDEVIEARPYEVLEGIAGISLQRTDKGFKIRISVGEYMYFDSPLIDRPEMAKTIFDGLKDRLHA